MQTRAVLLGGALLLTLLASVWSSGQEPPIAEAVAPPVDRAPPPQPETAPVAAPTEPPTLSARRDRQPPAAEVPDLFGSKNWNPPPPTPPPQVKRRAPPPPAPVAPPFPYTIAGSLTDSSGVTLVFTNQRQDFVVRVGEILERTYRVDAVDERSVRLTYLPMGLTQRVPFERLN